MDGNKLKFAIDLIHLNKVSNQYPVEYKTYSTAIRLQVWDGIFNEYSTIFVVFFF